ncbi:MAG: AAA family ATPase, partial [Verrucomicrobia bacterium]|nr:AAA family ATPase [Verrucomicrobiota bacterium]
MSQGLILGGMHSSDGKTVVTCLLLAALKMRGLPVQPFKLGPDFIDPGYHRRAAGTPSYNLDFWLMGAEEIQDLVRTLAVHKIALVEGVMGLFDGSDPRSDRGSTMELARLLSWPVVLVVPAAKSGRSLSAALKGFMLEAGAQRISGVVLNGVSGRSHSEYLREAIEPLGMKVLGTIPPKEELRWPERYLGLQAVVEGNFPTAEELALIAEDYLDVNEF